LERCVSHDLARFHLGSLAALPYIIPPPNVLVDLIAT
jgi:hypothetical protein